MTFRIGCLLIALSTVALALKADLSGVTTAPLNLSTAFHELTVAPDGTVWVLTDAGNVGKLPPGGTYSEFTLPWGVDPFKIPYAQTLAIGMDGNVWVAGFNGHIARVTPIGTVTDFTANAGGFFPPSLIARGTDGAMWFFDRPAPGPGASNAWKLGRIDIYGQVTAYDLGISNDQLRGLVNGGDGNLWFIDENKNQVFKFSPLAGKVLGTFSIPSASNQNGDDVATLGPDGNVWFTRGTSIDRITPDGTITEFHIPSGAQPAAIVTGGDGNLWFSEPAASKIGQLVVSSITSGGSATINEIASVGNAYEFFTFPATAGGAGKTGDLAATPCPATTFLLYTSPPPAIYKVTQPNGTCADLSSSVSLNSDLILGPTAEIEIKNAGPNTANSVNVGVNFIGAKETVTATSVVPSPSDVQYTISGSVVTLRKASLAIGEILRATIFVVITNDVLESTNGVMVVASSATPDPNFYDNIAAVGSTLGPGFKKVPLPPVDPIVVNNPVQRGH